MLSLCLSCALFCTIAKAERTKLLEVDLKTGSRRSIDKSGPKSAADQELDAMLGEAMGKSFSTADLERIDKALRRYLRLARPRAMPRMLLFIYPGRITRSALKELREILVDIDLVVDPCGRSFCRESVGKNLELIGKSLKQAVIRTSNYTIRFKSVTVRTVQQLGGTTYDIYRFGADEVVRAGAQGGGMALVKRVEKAKAGYNRIMLREISRQARLRGVRLSKPPHLDRTRQAVKVTLAVKSDRVRFQGHVLKAIAAAAKALASSPLTPGQGQLVVLAQVQMRRTEKRVYRCSLAPARLHVAGRLSSKELWSNYVAYKQKGAQELNFDDAEAAGGNLRDGPGGGPDRTHEILSAHMNRLAPCLQKEAQRNRKFRRATLLFEVTGNGQAKNVRLKEASASGALRSCLARAVGSIRFVRHNQAPQSVVFPLMIQR